MIYILFIIMSGSGSTSTVSHEFDSREACVYAQEHLKLAVEKHNRLTSLVCLPKGVLDS